MFKKLCRKPLQQGPGTTLNKNCFIMKYYSFLLLMMMMAASCNLIGDRVRGNGNITTNTYDLKGFKSIDAAGGFHVLLTQGDAISVKVETDENLMKHLHIRVSEGDLKIETRNNARLLPSEGLKVYVSMPLVKKIEISGASNITAQNKFVQDEKLFIDLSGASEGTLDVRAPAVSIDVSGASTLRITGQTRDITADASGASTIHAADLKAENTNVEASGASKAHVFASISLKADASGASNISYSGNPAVKQNTSGAASVKKTQ